MSQTTQTPVRQRSRAALVAASLKPVEVPAADRVVAPTDNAAGAVTPEMRAAIEEYADANARKNAGARDEKAASKKLHGLMAKAEIETIEHKVNGKSWSAEIATPDVVVVDVEALKKLVDEATFMQIVSVTQDAVTRHLGTNILAKVTTTTKAKDAKLSIKGSR